MEKSCFSRLILSINTKVQEAVWNMYNVLCVHIQFYISSIMTSKQSKVGWDSIRCGFNGARSGCLCRMISSWEWWVCSGMEHVSATVWRLQCWGSDTVLSLFSPLWTWLCSAQHSTGLDWTGLDQHCGHCNGAALLSTSNYPKIALMFQGRKTSQFLASVLKREKGEHMCLSEHSWSSTLSFRLSPKTKKSWSKAAVR